MHVFCTWKFVKLQYSSVPDLVQHTVYDGCFKCSENNGPFIEGLGFIKQRIDPEAHLNLDTVDAAYKILPFRKKSLTYSERTVACRREHRTGPC